jgi:nuclear pore complex protein Nup62
MSPEEISATLRNKTLEEIINQWNDDLNEQLHAFHSQAKSTSALDKIIIDNGDQIGQAYEELLQLESIQKEIDQSLDYIDSQQQELNKLLDVLEQQVHTLLEQAPQAQPADEEREKA